MKRLTITCSILCLLGTAASANNNVNAQPGDPKKKQEAQSSFYLTDGYFSFFNLFSQEKPDTTQIVIPQPGPSPQRLKKD